MYGLMAIIGETVRLREICLDITHFYGATNGGKWWGQYFLQALRNPQTTI
jgi:hypothetical protein